MFNVDELLRWLDENGNTEVAATDGHAAHYRQFYGLTFPVSTHTMVLLDAGPFRIFAQHFARRGRRLGTVFLLHGYLDHSGLQAPTIDRLLDIGFDVVTFDHPGHGLSTGDRASIDNFDAYVECLTRVHSHYRDVIAPHVVMGHSLGGAISMTHMLKHPAMFPKAVLVAPLFRPKAWRIIRTVHRVGGRFLKAQPRLWRDNTRDHHFRHFIKEVDPLSPRAIPVEWVGAMFEWASTFETLPGVDASVLVVQGTDDGTVDWRANLPMIRSKFARVRIHMIHEGRHHLLNELDEWRSIAWEPIEPFLREHL